ncbi:MAG TPA: NPCBM/NEW2 domain-containing protein [Gemmataceae bacterium]|nr:NPCBM/NEW2 domain-containing protein [Gemmataceae bacterium]
MRTFRLAAAVSPTRQRGTIPRWRVGLTLALLLVTTAAPAADPSPLFTLETASGKALKGPLREIGPAWAVRLGDARSDGADVIALRRDGVALPPGPDGEHVAFANGDRLPGTIGDLDGDRLRFRTGPETLALPLPALSVLWLAPPDGAEPERLLRRLASEARTRDRVLLRNGDAVEGVLVGLDDKALRLEVNRKQLTVERAKVAAVALNTELSTTLRPKGAYGRLVLRDGTRLSLASAACADGRTLTGETLFKTPVSVPLDDLVALRVEGGPAVYLSELKARKFEHTPYLGAAWPYVLDGSADRRDLRLGGSTFDRGIGMHTESRLTYDLGGRYRRFEALVGLDDQTGKGGSARVRVLIDGKPADVGGADLAGGRDPIAVRLDVTGAKQLTLVAEFGERGGVRGHVDWAGARLVK